MLVLIRHINLLLKTLPSYIENNCAIPFAASKSKIRKKKNLSNFIRYKKGNKSEKAYKNK